MTAPHGTPANRVTITIDFDPLTRLSEEDVESFGKSIAVAAFEWGPIEDWTARRG